MIFSLENSPRGNVFFELPNTDVFCFFHSEQSVSITRELWFTSVCASLKLKNNVLILEQPFESIPELNFSLRWQTGEGFLWLAPRSFSVLFEASNQFSGSYESIKAFLSTSK